jgi:hypothetical protein
LRNGSECAPSRRFVALGVRGHSRKRVGKEVVVGVHRQDVPAGRALQNVPHAADDPEVGVDTEQADAAVGAKPTDGLDRFVVVAAVVEYEPLELRIGLGGYAPGQRVDVARHGVVHGRDQREQAAFRCEGIVGSASLAPLLEPLRIAVWLAPENDVEDERLGATWFVTPGR